MKINAIHETNEMIDSVTIENVSVVLDEKATIQVLIKDEQDNELVTRTLDMEGTDFDNWSGSDLPYVKNWVLAQLDLEEVVLPDGYDAYGN